ncbi:ABC transporter ATP-binding protein [bacterium]|nr:ABC transporter ATP-binding protein [bacterium]
MRTRGLTKSYGERRGVFDLDLEVRQGEIFGFLGPNGAGKTVTIRVLLDLIRPQRGRAEVFGLDSRRDAVAIHRAVGYLPGELALEPRLTGRQILTYLGNLRGGVEWSFVEQLAGRLELNLEQRFGEYSRGNKQKVGLVQAFMHRPRLLVLDEPTGGLDPLHQETVMELVREARDEGGSTVFFSSHILSEVQSLCERVGFIREGRLAQLGPVDELPGMNSYTVEAELGRPVPPETIFSIEGVSNVKVEGSSVSCTLRGDMAPLIQALSPYEPHRLVSREPSLSELFLHLYGASGDGDRDAGDGEQYVRPSKEV